VLQAARFGCSPDVPDAERTYGRGIDRKEAAMRLDPRPLQAAMAACALAALILAFTATSALAADHLTETTLDAPQSPVWGQSVPFTATVNDTTDPAAEPEGAVQFSVDGVATGDPVPLKVRSASFSTTLEIGPHTVSAAFASDDAFADSQASVTRTVGKASVNVVETASPNPSVAGQDVTFLASVTAAPPSTGAPTGKIWFVTPGGSQIVDPQDLVSGRAGFSGWAGAGQYRVLAVYLGDDHFIGSGASVDVTVGKAETATTLTSSATRVAPGQSVVLTALVGVKPPGDIATYGSLQFTANGAPIGSAIPLEGDHGVRVTLTAPSVRGTYTLGVNYSGDDDTIASAAPPLQITVGASGGGAATMAQQLRAVGSTLIGALRKRGLAALSGTPEPFTAPSAGVLEQQVDTPNTLKAAKAVRLASGRRAFNGPVLGVLKLRLTGAGRRAIRRGRTLRLTIRTTFTPTAGKAVRVVQRLTVKAKKGRKVSVADPGWTVRAVRRAPRRPTVRHTHGRL
jgi:hypothetical protein